LFIAISVLSMSFSGVYALPAAQKELYDLGIGYFDLFDDACAVGSEPTDGNVYVLGDSLTVGMKESGDLNNKLSNAGWRVTNVNATVGISISGSIPKIEEDKSNIEK